MLYYAFQLLRKVLDEKVSYPERDYAQSLFYDYSNRIKIILIELKIISAQII